MLFWRILWGESDFFAVAKALYCQNEIDFREGVTSWI